MTKDLRLIAIHEIHLPGEPGVAGDKSKGIPPKLPKPRIVKPKKLFTADSAGQFEELTAGRNPAARVPTKADLGVAATAAVVEDDAPENQDEAAIRKQYAEIMGEEPRGNMKVETMQKRIEEKLAEDSTGGDGAATDLV